MSQNIAKTIIGGPRSERVEYPEQIRRLVGALRVAEKWMEDARDDSGVMWNQAEYTRDKIQEELARECFEAGVAERLRVFKQLAEHDDSSAGEASAGLEEMREDAISDALVEAFCILRDAPADLFPDSSHRPRARYEVMGALMVALDNVNAKPEKATA